MCLIPFYFNNKKDILDKFRIDSISSEGLEDQLRPIYHQERDIQFQKQCHC